MECSHDLSLLLSCVPDLPVELVEIIRHGSNEAFLTALSTATLLPQYTDLLFPYLKPIFPEICSRWMSNPNGAQVLAAFGRIIPFAPYLAEYAERYFEVTLNDAIDLTNISDVGPSEERLLGLFRMLACESQSFARRLDLGRIYENLQHKSGSVQYLSIRIICILLGAADCAMEEMVYKYLGNTEITGARDGMVIDYRFLSLWEEERFKAMTKKLRSVDEMRQTEIELLCRRVLRPVDLSPLSVDVFGVLMPRLVDTPSETHRVDSLVPTHTAVENVRNLAQNLLKSDALLLTGLAGAGKTAIITYLAKQLNKLDSMVTLHLNQQSDAKLLVGIYTSGTTPGTFVWRPGALTTAVREGRWVFIEDLDRAPNEVMSTLLPLIERGELLIPGRGEVLKAARGFKIIATMRTTSNLRGQEQLVRAHNIGTRFWQRVSVAMLPDEELGHIVRETYPVLKAHAPQVIRVYSQIQALLKGSGFSAEVKTGAARALTPRDLFKWCGRMASFLSNAKDFTDGDVDDMFLEAIDCFAGHLPVGRALEIIASCIAQELRIDPMRRDHLLQNREVSFQPSKDGSGSIVVGRVRLQRKGGSRPKRQERAPFARNHHTLQLLEKLAVGVKQQEPLLLVGETGIGKTTCIQHLAERLGRKMVAFNLSQQSESSDLLGGFKPVNVRSLIMPLKDEFDDLFRATFSNKDNRQFSDMLGKCLARAQWKRVCKLWASAIAEVERKFRSSTPSSPRASESHHPRKRQKVDSNGETVSSKLSPELHQRWEKFSADIKRIEAQLMSKSDALAFTFIEGNIVKAVRNGDWVLLDEINLATPDTLEALVDLLGGSLGDAPSILLTESGKIERVVAHPDFRLFAAMNPATDVAKRDLPPGIRSRFTEIYVDSPDRDPRSLQSIVESYLDKNSLDRVLVSDVTELYMQIQKMAASNVLADGAGQKPHFSLRTLTRTLVYARDVVSLGGPTAKDRFYRRALFEGFSMSFLTLLDNASEKLLAPVIKKHLFGKHPNIEADLRKLLPKPNDGNEYVQEHHYWIRKGEFVPEDQPYYIITPFVQRNLDNLIRAASTRRYPILIQGPTSSGKTSMIEYLAKRSGNKFVRINNHEHTDLQEYLGAYVSDSDGKLRFQEGILVEALRKGYWIVLDELNLAPSDILEALNRLLDDNRELFIPETQETVRPHDNFMLFATQNPAGLYGGRKHLSRAFRNRFLELHFDDIPVDELCEILHQRTQIPNSWSRRIVDVYKELSSMRQESRLFEQKSFATLRDLFRWALRKADTIDQLAVNGYMLLAERVRKPEEVEKVRKIIEQVMSRNGPRVTIGQDLIYSSATCPEMNMYESHGNSAGVIWTKSMRRLFVLVAHALRNNEPVLLVGETGCGKTTVCQMLADAFGKELMVVNAHQNTETGDLIGSQRPIRNRAAIELQLREQLISVLTSLGGQDLEGQDNKALLQAYIGIKPKAAVSIPSNVRQTIKTLRNKAAALFEWTDGSLVHAMKTGQYFLLDEISLADDSVLERLNSVLEPGRTLLLAEKGPIDSAITAGEGFQFLATMNPGGDYGKRELSPALRNRFTEIWVPSLYDIEDITQIVRGKLQGPTVEYTDAMVAFASWFSHTYNTSAASAISIRDALAWVAFVNRFASIDPALAVLHGAAMVYIDTLGANPAAMLSISSSSILGERQNCVAKLSELLAVDVAVQYFAPVDLRITEAEFEIGPFSLPREDAMDENIEFTFEPPTTRGNAMRVFRALQLNKPILIEGNPGVGKTTLVSAISKALGKRLVRINLSDQTDLMDLFGSDVPVEGAAAGTFTWRDAPFLSAMKNGDWVLLDEMNLASQSVLEGLNACLDHRAEAYVAELDQTFKRHPDFRLFAAQNPHHQGGGRKGLPASFVNRFTVVYADVFRPEDMMIICKSIFPSVPEDQLATLIKFVAQIDTDTVYSRKFGAQGSPWEFNLRDTIRWLQLATSSKGLVKAATPYDLCDIIFRQRFRSTSDKIAVDALFDDHFESKARPRNFFHNLTTRHSQVGVGLLNRGQLTTQSRPLCPFLTTAHLPVLEALSLCVQQNWPVILVGSSGSGKTTVIEHAAAVVGAETISFPMNADIDAMDLVGGYEQADPLRQKFHIVSEVRSFAHEQIIIAAKSAVHEHIGALIVLETVASQGSSKADLAGILASLQKLVSHSESRRVLELSRAVAALEALPDQIEKAQFEWVDGLLVQALERGNWLILDNANLCSSSVLDRLNSLLEPNGELSLTEHPLDNGDARIVRPHPNFRIFLTMDPRNGELSRAMRNRAIELYLPPLPENDVAVGQGRFCFGLESSMYRFRNFAKCEAVARSNLKVVDVAIDHLGHLDQHIEKSFQNQVAQGLLTTEEEIKSNIVSKIQLMIPVKHSLDSGMGEGYYTLETMHPLNNDVVFRYCANPLHSKLAEEIEDRIHVSAMAKRYEQAARLADTKPVQQMTPFDYSAASTRLPAHKRDSSRDVAQFLRESLDLMSRFFQLTSELNRDSETIRINRAFIRFWTDLFDLVQAPKLEEAVFQMYLRLGSSAISRLTGNLDVDRVFLKQLANMLRVFIRMTNFTTGHSMERLWETFRPVTAPTLDRVHTLLRLEALADQFDALASPARVPLEELSRIRGAFAQALVAVKQQDVDAAGLLEMLKSTIGEFRTDDEKEVVEVVVPFFQAEFEAISQCFDLCSLTDLERGKPALLQYVEIMAQRSTKVKTLEGIDEIKKRILMALDCYVGSDGVEVPRALDQNVLTFVARKMARLDSVPLGRLDLLKSEVDVLGQVLSTGASTICEDQTLYLHAVLRRLMDVVLNAHQDILQQVPGYEKPNLIALNHLLSQPQPISNEISEILDPLRALNVAASYLQATPGSNPQDLATAAEAWIRFSLACIALYVPDRPFDPALRYKVLREWFLKDKNQIMTDLDALERFDLEFQGQKHTLRSAIVQDRLAEIGEEPAELMIARPPPAQLSQLQGEFNNVLRVAKAVDQAMSEGVGAVASCNEGKNIASVLKRLRNAHRAYDDLVLPLIGLLQALNVGLGLAKRATKAEHGAEHGKDGRNTLQGLLTLREEEPDLLRTSEEFDSLVTSLRRVALLANVEKVQEPKRRAINEAHELFDTVYNNWKRDMTEEQKKHRDQHSLYTYQGSHEGDEAQAEKEYDELFPDYDKQAEDDEKPQSKGPKLLDAGNEIAELHGQIFCGGASPHDLVKSVLLAGFSKKEPEADYAPLLPALYLAFQRTKGVLDSTENDTPTYNFYVSPNTVEAKRLAAFVHRLQARFRELQRAWPEHATLHEVLTLGDKILEFAHTEPVAKFLAKAEKLHEAVDRWEKVASKEFSATVLYSELTALLVSWRRLELGTWMRLFDLETEKCVADARNWWFVAYENVIAAPLSLVQQGESVDRHVKELLKTLEAFFATTSLGQYSARLHLIRVFERRLAAQEDVVPALASLRDGLRNFLSYYARFEGTVSEDLAKGRLALEKKVKEIILLASWKDTNIEALKQSAKVSHRKLFKVVRKFRTLLGRSVQGIVQLGPVDKTVAGIPDLAILPSRVEVDQKAVSICQTHISDWDATPSRFKNVAVTASLMFKLSQPPQDTADGSAYITAFLSDLDETTKALQEETPAFLTEENQPMVKHLKTRKRTLFADTLKTLRLMGLQYNLSSHVLLAQNSVASVFATLPALSASGEIPAIECAEFFFHKVLSLMADVREVQREHSPDLTPAEIARSVGYLEDLLHRQVTQRATIAGALNDFAQLNSAVEKARNLWATKYAFVQDSADLDLVPVLRTIQWLIPLTSVMAHVVSAHSELGKQDTSAVSAALTRCSSELASLVQRAERLPHLPENITSTVHTALLADAQVALKSLAQHVSSWTLTYPALAPLLRQLLPWIQMPYVERKERALAAVTLGAVRQAVFACVDQTLGAVQDLSKVWADMPTSSDEVSWYTREEAGYVGAVAAVRAGTVARGLEQMLSSMGGLSGEELGVAAALIGVVAPIVEQFRETFLAVLSRFAGFHLATCRIAWRLCAAFVEIGKRGFCTPPEKSGGKNEGEEKLEGGTGLGEGEGAEDISKDIKDDEDLDELAEQEDEGGKKDIEEEKDAVDMGDSEMKGETGDVEEEEGEEGQSGDEKEEDEMEDETGSVDDLGPSAVDERLWDEGGEADKEKEGDQSKGEKEDDQAAAQLQKEQQQAQEAEQDDLEAEEAPPDEPEAVGQQETEKMDPHVDEEEALDLPDDMNLDGGDADKSDGELDDLDLEDDEQPQQEMETDELMPDQPEVDETRDGDETAAEDAEDTNEGVEDPDADQPEDTDGEDSDGEEDDNPLALEDDATIAAEDAAPSEPRGTGADAADSAQDTKAANTSAPEDAGTEDPQDPSSAEAGRDGAQGESGTENAVGQAEDAPSCPPDEAQFRKLGDALEKWYQKQKAIQAAREDDGEKGEEKERDVDMQDADFEHLRDEQSKSEAQALGAASEDQARALEQDNAVAGNENELQQGFAEDENEQPEELEQDDVSMPDADASAADPEAPGPQSASGPPTSFIGPPTSAPRPAADSEADLADAANDEHLSTDLSTIHLTPDSPPTPAHALWQHHESRTRALSTTLTEQLRLILAPTLASKLRGDFRTGKRLNVKRIIPYIASGYKRDKIWLRRDAPNRRAYQIMLALDDSRSMAGGATPGVNGSTGTNGATVVSGQETGATLALDTLALVARALSTLESGALSIVNFGETVRTVHPFAQPFSDAAGAAAFGSFSFSQERTDVRALLRVALEEFRSARTMGAAGAGDGVWQILLVVSDGVCEGHEEVGRLVREAWAEGIMVVFVVVDAEAMASGAGDGKSGGGIMELQRVEFVEEGGEVRVVRGRYMDTFPFRWWVVVRDVRELPGVLAGALRQWFAEVVEAGA
ncbi:midasin [Trichodelitschia bisporula]|uniref:Midasin n=1 Tax=Trichodelitschia bisporula TaxID=703511 RepID=A0A6G1HXR6_9PEZI|nr:midasin [Trichodelitschia bisporula]